jgi:DNA polymerase-1
MKTHSKAFKVADCDQAYTYINDNETAKKLVYKLQTYKKEWKDPKGYRMGLDIETDHKNEFRNHCPKRGRKAGLCPHLSRIRLVQIYDLKGMTWILDMFHVDHNIVIEILKAHQWVAHNAVFEQSHIRKLSPELEKLDIECSMVQALLIDRAERSPFEPDDEDEDEVEEDDSRVKTQGFGLHALSMKYLKFPLKKEYQASGWDAAELEPERLAYAAIDAVVCKRLWDTMNPIIEKYEMQKIYRLSNLMVPVIAEMEATGMSIDHQKHAELIAKWTVDAEKRKEITDKYFPGVNLNSPKQLGEWTQANLSQEVADWPRSKKGGLSFGRPAIAHLKKYPAIDALIEYKKVAKMLSTYGTSLRDFLHPFSGRLHPSYSLAETRTGRLSSSSPNGQNFPRDKDFRSMFIAPKGTSLVIYDLNQIEIRVAAELSQDKVMKSAFEHGVDLHKLIVSRMTGRPVSEMTDDDRKLGKTCNFGLQFGMGGEKLAKQVAYQIGHVMSTEEGWNAKNTYDDLYRGYTNWGELQRLRSTERGYVTTPLGKRRKLAEGEIYTKSLNCPVQGGAAEVLMCALVALFHSIRKQNLQKYIRIAATIHDEVWLLVAEGYEQQGADLLQTAMVNGMLHVFPKANVNKLSAGGFGKRWSECK